MSQYPRIYFPEKIFIGDELQIHGSEAHYLIHVLRIKKGENIFLFTGKNKEFLARVEKVSETQLSVHVFKSREGVMKPWKTILVQAIPKAQKMDWVIEKATELGVDEIYPVFTERVVKRSSRIDRWKKIALSAAKQCHRLDVSEIHSTQDWTESLAHMRDVDLKLIATLSDSPRLSLHQAIQLVPRIQTVALAIGPEGDFTEKEIKEAKERGWIPVSLGPFILKSETAAIAGLAILEHELMKDVL